MNQRRYKLQNVLLTVALILMVSGCGKHEIPPEAVAPTESISSEQEELEPVVQITMPGYELTYSGELQDLISTKELQREQSSGLEFTVKLGEKEATIFTMYYNTDEGDMVIMLADADGNRIPVAFQMTKMPNDLNEKEQLTFYGAQEIVNEVVESIVLK